MPTTTPASDTTHADSPTDAAVEGTRRVSWYGDGLFAGGLAILIGYAAWLGRDLTFFSDEWPIIAFHYNGRYLVPYDNHLLLLPIAIYHVLFATVGLGSYTPYRAVGLAGYALFGGVLYAYLRRQIDPVLAALAALSVVWYSAAQLNVLFPLALNFSLPLAALTGIWMLLDRRQPRLDIVAGILLAVSLASGGVGLVPVVAVGVELAFLRAPIRRWVPFVVPVVLWFAWYVKYQTPVTNPNSIGGTVRFAAHQVQATFAGFVGGWDVGGWILLFAAATVFSLAVVRWHTFSGRAAGALAGMGAFAVLTGYAARHGSLPALPADTPRYLWVDAFFVVIALVEVIRPLALSWVVPTAVAVLVAIGAVTLIGNLRTYNQQVVQYKHTTRTFMVAVEAIPNQVDRDRIMPFSYNLVRAGDYLAAVAHLGSPVAHVTLRDLGTESERATADGWMTHDLGLAVTAAPAVPLGRCTTISTLRDVRLPPGDALLIHAGAARATVSVRRLARHFSSPLGMIPPQAVGQLRVRRDASSLPWYVQIGGAPESVVECP